MAGEFAHLPELFRECTLSSPTAYSLGRTADVGELTINNIGANLGSIDLGQVLLELQLNLAPNCRDYLDWLAGDLYLPQVDYEINNTLISTVMARPKLSKQEDAAIRTNAMHALAMHGKRWIAMAETCEHPSMHYRVEEMISYTKDCIAQADPNGRPPLLGLGLCGTPESKGDVSLALGGSCKGERETPPTRGKYFSPCNSVKGWLSIVGCLKKMKVIQLVNEEHLSPTAVVNARHCPLTTEDCRGKRWGCPSYEEIEAELAAEQLNFLTGFYVDLGLLPIVLDLAGIDPDKSGTILVHNRLDKEKIALFASGLLHLQFWDTGVDPRVLDQIGDLSFIVDEFMGRLQKKKGFAAKIGKFLTSSKSFEVLFLDQAHFDASKLAFLRRKKKEADDRRWEVRYAALVAYEREHGDCKVPQLYPEDPQLGMWVHNQRRSYKQWKQGKRSSLNDDRVQRLEDVGFVWSTQNLGWEENFKLLQAFKAKKGHCIVPRRYAEDLQLGTWVNNQRARYKKWLETKKDGEMTADRVQRLEAIGFAWNANEEKWNSMFAKLRAYKVKKGDCNVPQSYAEDPQLGRWVNNQRNAYKKWKKTKKDGKMNAKRADKLETIGCVG